MDHKFGGSWTATKLSALRAYLTAYETIFAHNPRARYFRRVYLDAFAGTGYLSVASDEVDEAGQHVSEYLQGSAAIALELPEGFDEYIFVDFKRQHTIELEKLKTSYPDKSDRISIVRADANKYIETWCRTTDWKTHRAIVFLDPYGMQVDWNTIIDLKNTNAVDLWLLFPLGMGVMRMLTNKGVPPADWAAKLTRFFGSDEWQVAFYRPDPQETMFDEPQRQIKTASYQKIKAFAESRLKHLFGDQAVASPLELVNEHGTPLYLLFFAAANPKGAPTAVIIARHILGR